MVRAVELLSMVVEQQNRRPAKGYQRRLGTDVGSMYMEEKDEPIPHKTLLLLAAIQTGSPALSLSRPCCLYLRRQCRQRLSFPNRHSIPLEYCGRCLRLTLSEDGSNARRFGCSFKSLPPESVRYINPLKFDQCRGSTDDGAPGPRVPGSSVTSACRAARARSNEELSARIEAHSAYSAWVPLALDLI